MSWQSYIDDQLLNTKMVTHAVICGHDGNIWATSSDFSVRILYFEPYLFKFLEEQSFQFDYQFLQKEF